MPYRVLTDQWQVSFTYPGSRADTTASLPEPFLSYTGQCCNVIKYQSPQPLLLLQQVVLAQHML